MKPLPANDFPGSSLTKELRGRPSDPAPGRVAGDGPDGSLLRKLTLLVAAEAKPQQLAISEYWANTCSRARRRRGGDPRMLFPQGPGQARGAEALLTARGAPYGAGHGSAPRRAPANPARSSRGGRAH